MFNKNEKYIIVILSVLIMIFSVHIGSTLFNKVQIDATDENRYSLSEGSLAILSKLNSPLRIKLYYSKTAANKGSEGIRQFNAYFQYVNDFLEQVVAKSNNTLSLEIIDPRPDTRDEEDAIAYGLKKFNLTETETYFFGLVVENSTGAEKIIEFLNPGNEHRLEYDVIKLIYSATNPKKPRVGVLSSLDVMKEDVSPYIAQLMKFQGKPVEESWQFIKVMKEFYDVVNLNNELNEQPAVDILMVIHPKELSEQSLYFIDQFVMGGGKLMVFLDPVALIDQSVDNQNPTANINSDLSLLKKWGIDYDPTLMVGDKYLAGSARLSPNMPPVKTLPLLVCNNSCFAKHNDIISSSLSFTSFIFSGALKAIDGEGYTVIPFGSTTEKGNTFKVNSRQLQNMMALWQSFTEGSEPQSLAMKTVGKFKTNYPDGITVEVGENKDNETEEQVKKTEKTLTKKLEPILENSEDTAIIVFPDVDFISNPYAFKDSPSGKIPSNDNISLVLNSLETLTGSTELLSVRSKLMIDRGFDIIREIELDAEKKTANKVKEINERIAEVQKELSLLSRQANEDNIAAIQSEGIKKRKELSRQIAIYKRELRDVKREGRERIESLGSLLQILNTMFIPIILVLIGFFINKRRKSLA